MKNKSFLSFFCILLIGITATAQQQGTAGNLDEEAIKQANNPLAPIKAFNVHNYYMPTLYGEEGSSLNQAWLRYAQPLGKFILRGSLPIVTSSMSGRTPESGLGDFNLFAIYLVSKKGAANEIGIGPAISAPTGTNNMGSGKWQAGLSVLAFLKSNPVFQAGGLVTWQASFAGDGSREDMNSLTAQPFLMFQLGKGTYLRSTGIWTFDLRKGNYNVPIGLGIGQVLKAGNTVFNIFIEPQYSVFAYGMGQPSFQLFIGFNSQFH